MTTRTLHILFALLTGTACADSDDIVTRGRSLDCEAGPSTNLTALRQASQAAVRAFFGAEGGFENGIVSFHDAAPPNTDQCRNDHAVIAYTVTVPQEHRHQALYIGNDRTDDQAIVVWGLDGNTFDVPTILAGHSLDDQRHHPYVRGRFLSVAIFEFNVGDEIEAAELAAQLTTAYPYLNRMDGSLVLTEGNQFQGPTLEVSAAASLWGALLTPTRLHDQFAIADEIGLSGLVAKTHLFGWNSRGDFVPGEVLSDETIALDCLRSASADAQFVTETSLAPPLGTGRIVRDACLLN